MNFLQDIAWTLSKILSRPISPEHLKNQNKVFNVNNPKFQVKLSFSKEDYNYLVNLERTLHYDNKDSFKAVKHMENSIASTPSSSISSTTWILDHGESNHVFPFIHSFSTIKEITHVFFSNGQSTIAYFDGQIYFSKDIFLNNVLYIAKF